MTVLNLGIDLGRSETRLYDGRHLLSFPSVVGGPIETIARGNYKLAKAENNLFVEVDGQPHSVGRYALEQPFLFPVSDPHPLRGELNRVLFLTALGLGAQRLRWSGRTRLNVCVGLPVCFARNEALTRELTRGWLGQQKVVFRGEPMEFEVERIEVIPQPLGTVYQAILDEKIPMGSDSNGIEQSIGVISVGHQSANWLVVSSLQELTKYSSHITSGVGYRLHEAIADYLSEQHGLFQQNPIDLADSVVSGVYNDLEGNAYPIPPQLIERVKRSVARQVALTVEQSWRNIKLDHMLLSGGMGGAIFELMQENHYFHRLQRMDDARYANVKGYYEYIEAMEPASPAGREGEPRELVLEGNA